MEASARRGPGWPVVCVLAAAILASVAIRWPLLDVPLERDEGEYAYAAQQLLEGVAPYRSLYSMKWPGCYLIYASAMWLGGQTVEVIHLSLLAATVASTLLLFALARTSMPDEAAVIAAGAFAAMALSPGVLGLAAQTEAFGLPFVLSGAALLAKRHATRAWWPAVLAGLCFGAAATIKQHAAAFLLLAYVLMWTTAAPAVRARRMAAFTAAAALPLTGLVLWMWASDTLDSFWFWTIRYSTLYAMPADWATAAANLLRSLVQMVRFAPLLSLASAVALVWLPIDGAIHRNKGTAAMMAICALLAISPGFHFRRHYFVFLLPAAALAIGHGADHIFSNRAFFRAPHLRSLVAGSTVALGFVAPIAWLVGRTPEEVCRLEYGPNPFVEAVAVGQYLQRHTRADDTIAVMGSEPEIYFYARPRAASPYVYMYEMMKPHSRAARMQRELIDDIERAQPEFIVMVGYLTSWLLQPGADTTLLQWIPRYTATHYEKVGHVERRQSGDVVAYWGPGARNHRPSTRRYMAIYQRR